jgi:hypothetical protein
MKTITVTLALILTVVMTGIAGSKPNRTFNKRSYNILDTTGFYLYSHDQLVQGMKIARPGTVYYFSLDAGSTILPLTIPDLEKAFAHNEAFCYRLHTDFSSDKDLLTWLPTLKTYKIKYAYEQSSK